MEKKNVRTELPKATAGRFKEWLRNNHIKFEPSECGDLIHFEVWATEEQIEAGNTFIDTNC